MALPRIYIIATGGTIAGTANSSTQMTGYKAGSLSIQKLVDAVPQICSYAEVSGEQLFSVGSQNLSNGNLITLAQRCNEILSGNQWDGIVITHGTATLEETAYFLNLTVKSAKPVVIVGAQRPATAISADGPLNLLNAIALASDTQSVGKGVLVCMNDMFGGAREMVKTNTTNVSTFKSFELGIFGYRAAGRNWFVSQSVKKHTEATEFDVSGLKDLPRVDIVLSHVSADRVPYDAFVQAGARGIVLAGTGNGAFHRDEWAGILDAIKSGVVVVRASRIPCGPVTPNHKEWEEAGMLYAGTLNPQKARILLQLALTRTHDLKAIQTMFDTY